MKVMRFPLGDGGEAVALVHDFQFVDPDQPSPCTVDLWAMMMGVDDGAKNAGAIEAFGHAGLALRQKVAAVESQHELLVAASAEPIAWPRSNVRPYTREQRILGAIEAFLNAVYGVLEMVATCNRLADRQLPDGYRSQMKRSPDMSPERYSWLGAFYDLRSELAHYSSPIFHAVRPEMTVRFVRARENMHFVEKSRSHQIDLDTILEFKDGLDKLVDDWSRANLAKIDRGATIELFAIGRNGELVPARMSVAELFAKASPPV